MTIAFSCPSCDRTYTVGDQSAGTVTACKGCSTRMIVPDAEGEPDPRPRPKARVVAVSPPTSPPPRNPSRREEADEFEVVEEPPSRSRDAFAEDAARYARKAARKQRRRERDKILREEHGNSLAVSRTIVRGLCTMAFSAVWFFGGLMFGILFYFPPILFCIGLGILIMGLMGRED